MACDGLPEISYYNHLLSLRKNPSHVILKKLKNNGYSLMSVEIFHASMISEKKL